MRLSQVIYELEATYPLQNQRGKHIEDYHFDIDVLRSDHEQWLTETLERFYRDGLVILTNTGISCAKGISRLTAKLPFESIDYIGGTNKRHQLSQGLLNTGNEPPHANISAHNEMSYSFLDHYPKVFVLGCFRAAQSGGETLLGDNVGITDDFLQSSVGRKFVARGVRYIRNLGSRQNPGNHHLFWQDAFGVQDRASVEALLAQCQNIGHIAWNRDDSLSFSYTRPALEFDPVLERNLCFVSIGNHGYWFRQWPPYSEMENHHRPHHLTFGDGEELSEQDVQDMAQMTVKHTIKQRWKSGDVVICDNLRTTHGRLPYNPEIAKSRRIGVVMLSPVPRRGACHHAKDAVTLGDSTG